MQVPEPWWDKFKNNDLPLRARPDQAENLSHSRAALAMCENIDWNVGRLMKKLDDLEIAENTIVIYFSDNGPNSYRWNGGMKGRKGSIDEGGLRSPFFIRWPDHIEANSRVPQIAGAIDLLPTLTDLAGIAPKTAKPVDGRSLSPLLLGESSAWPERALLAFNKGKASVRTQRYRLDGNGQLFDITADPGQRNNLTKQHPELTQKLRKLATQHAQQMRPHVRLVGEFLAEVLGPARDELPHAHGIGTDLGGGVGIGAFEQFLQEPRDLDGPIALPLQIAGLEGHHHAEPQDQDHEGSGCRHGEAIAAYELPDAVPDARGPGHDRLVAKVTLQVVADLGGRLFHGFLHDFAAAFCIGHTRRKHVTQG